MMIMKITNNDVKNYLLTVNLISQQYQFICKKVCNCPTIVTFKYSKNYQQLIYGGNINLKRHNHQLSTGK